MQTRLYENDRKMNNCALYLRLSKEDEKGAESASIETQRKLLRDYTEKNGFKIYDEYVDDGYTGTNFNRPAFQRMLRDVENGRIQIIITKDLSRLGRNSGRINILMDEYFPEHHVRYISLSEGIDTAEWTAANSIVAPVQSLVNELYAGDISRKIHAAFGVKMQEGAYIGAFAPYGYGKDPKNKNHLVVDETSGAVVRRMFSMARGGHSPAQIAAIFNAEGILTPSRYRYQRNPQLDTDQFRGATEWKATNINKMLRNEIYLGHTLQGKTYKPSFKSKYCYAKPREEWVVVRNTHESLVDEETWNVVRKRMQSRTRKREKGFVNLFSGLAKCADCGRNMSTAGTRKKGATANLNCGGYKLGGRKYCTNHTINYDVLYQVVLRVLREQMHLSDQEKQRLLQAVLRDMEKQDGLAERELEGKIRSIGKKLEQLFEDKYDGLIGQKQFARLHQRYTKELAELEEKRQILQAAKGEKEEFAEEKQRNEQLRSLIDAYTDLQALDAELLFQLIERIEIHQGEYTAGEKQQRVDIWLRFPCEPKTMEVTFAPQ